MAFARYFWGILSSSLSGAFKFWVSLRALAIVVLGTSFAWFYEWGPVNILRELGVVWVWWLAPLVALLVVTFGMNVLLRIPYLKWKEASDKLNTLLSETDEERRSIVLAGLMVVNRWNEFLADLGASIKQVREDDGDAITFPISEDVREAHIRRIRTDLRRMEILVYDAKPENILIYQPLVKRAVASFAKQVVDFESLPNLEGTWLLEATEAMATLFSRVRSDLVGFDLLTLDKGGAPIQSTDEPYLET